MKTYEQLEQEAIEHELVAAERQYAWAQNMLSDVIRNGTDEQFERQWALTEATRNQLNWLRSVRK